MTNEKPAVHVIGDAILDLHRRVIYQRPSPEDPRCPVAAEEQQRFDLGGAANVARWIAGLGEIRKVVLHHHAPRFWKYDLVFRRELARAKVCGSRHLARDAGYGTVKERIYLHREEGSPAEQVIRIDQDTNIQINATEAATLCHVLEADLSWESARPAMIVAVDYGKGVFSGDAGARLIENLSAFCRERGMPALVNSKCPERWRGFDGDFLICNRQEHARFGPFTPTEIGASHLIITRAEEGAEALAFGGARWAVNRVMAPAPCSEVLDVTGAGDAFLAGLVAHLIASGFRRGVLLDDAALARALAAAQAAAARCVQQVGCGEPPGQEEATAC